MGCLPVLLDSDWLPPMVWVFAGAAFVYRNAVNRVEAENWWQMDWWVGRGRKEKNEMKFAWWKDTGYLRKVAFVYLNDQDLLESCDSSLTFIFPLTGWWSPLYMQKRMTLCRSFREASIPGNDQIGKKHLVQWWGILFCCLSSLKGSFVYSVWFNVADCSLQVIMPIITL